MVLLEKLWDDVLAGPQPERGLSKLRGKTSANPLLINHGKLYQRSMSMPETPVTPASPLSAAAAEPAKKANVWRSVFHPGSNINAKTIGADLFDRPQPNTPTVYDWMYSDETRSKHR
ncbi:auxin-repressed 12.5 kDa protein-like [Phalaenopsis equestris]|uniref:auxin-repressed 12.5 kDa protein-like n=1 Tax=Phalaenopsis equestris TaxID=78828 RepID=UPI0009E4DAC0|nr:auxin-repressed 12.5 kDa protein-like [Phalaenopsis equestris]